MKMSRSAAEEVVRNIGGTVVSSSDDQLHFKGGSIPFRFQVILKSCTVFDAGDSIGCTVEVSIATLVLPGLFGSVIAMIALFVHGVVALMVTPVVAVAVGAFLMVGGKAEARYWLIKRIEAQQRAQADDAHPAGERRG